MLTLALCLVTGASQILAFRPQVAPRDTDMARAESLFGAGKLPEARRIAETIQYQNPRNAKVLVLLGRIHLAWPVIGRFPAESLLTDAVALLPGDPEPLYYLGLVGIALGADDGEAIARRGLVPVLAIDPDYRDTWAKWLTLYRSDGDRRAAIAALDRHRGSWDADLWRAQLLFELRLYPDAADLFEELVQRRPADPAPWAWLARTRFTTGADAAGAAAYDSALNRAALDTGAVLWKQIRGIATGSERGVWVTTSPARRTAFFRKFWAVREPDLRTRINERLGEHFRRMAQARRMFALRHPNARYFRSKLFRALSGGVGAMPGGLGGAEAHARDSQCAPRLPGVRDDAVRAGAVPRVGGSEDTTLNLEDGLDDRGRIFLRHGEPTFKVVGSLSDETWCYVRPDGSVLGVTFVRRTGGYGVSGEMVITPVMVGQAEAANELLATDRFSAVSTLSFAFWPAAFRAGENRWQTQLYVIPDSLGAVATLIDDEGVEVARDSGTDRALALVADPGRYYLMIDGARGNRSGRYRGTIALPDYATDVPAISSILLAPGVTPPVRDSVADAAPHGLLLTADQPVRVYAELYNMGRIDSTSRYTAEYRFERTDGFILRGRRERATTVAFERQVAFTPRIIETLVVDPGRLPPGRYRLHIEITDQVRGQRTASSVIEFRLR